MRLMAECASASCIDSINGIIHDCIFSVKDVRFDTERKTVRVPFRAAESVVASWFSFGRSKRHLAFVLEIGNVQAMRCEDEQKIEVYNLNELEYQSANGELKIRTGIPTKFDVKVEGLLLRIFSSSSPS